MRVFFLGPQVQGISQKCFRTPKRVSFTPRARASRRVRLLVVGETHLQESARRMRQRRRQGGGFRRLLHLSIPEDRPAKGTLQQQRRSMDSKRSAAPAKVLCDIVPQ
eukprot:TRINITY_DN18547_c0_g2_i1.p4 TRINITY_DN18547_c0_g2~~TRINITY_DN18547_c0_g2_i1.p4  ORF type:complete len:107 (+),score=19.59 TRINITY_DN18547_c0_g2_i1:597-917(+)